MISTALHGAGDDDKHYSTHTCSFRNGAAPSAKKAGISDVHIKMLGHWKSDAQLYIRTPRAQLAQLSAQLVSSK